MSYEEILQQLKDYVFSDEDPKHCAERYMEVMKIPFRLQIIPLAEQAIYTLNEEFQKVDNPKGRANVAALFSMLNEKRVDMFQKVVSRFDEDQGIILDPDVIVDGDAVQTAINYNYMTVNNAMIDKPELWQTVCSEQNIDIQEYPTFQDFAANNVQKKYLDFAREKGLEETASKVLGLGMPISAPKKLDKHPLILPDNQTVGTAEYYARCDSALQSKLSPAAKNLFKHWFVTPQYADFIDPAYRDIGKADLKSMNQEQRGAYLGMMEDLRALGRFLEDSKTPRTFQEKAQVSNYTKAILGSAETFLQKTRDSGPELKAVKAGVYGLMLQLALPNYGPLERARNYLTQDIIQAGQENAQRYSHFHKKEKISLEALQEDAPPAPAAKSLWTQGEEALSQIRVRDTKMDPGMKAAQEETRRNFLTLCEKAKQTGDGRLPEKMAEKHSEKRLPPRR